MDYILKGVLPRERTQAHQIKQRALSYAVVDGVLYRRSYDHMWLRCLGKHEARRIVTEIHSGLCGAHQSGPKMKDKIKRIDPPYPSDFLLITPTEPLCLPIVLLSHGSAYSTQIVTW